jgi:hypothetical protein
MSSEEYARFDELARTIINAPKPDAESAGEPTGEPADDDSEGEDG